MNFYIRKNYNEYELINKSNFNYILKSIVKYNINKHKYIELSI